MGVLPETWFPIETIVDPVDDMRQKRLLGNDFETLLKPLVREGKSVLTSEQKDAMSARQRTEASLNSLDESQKRMLNPHTYPVGLEYGLWERRRALVAALRDLA